MRRPTSEGRRYTVASSNIPAPSQNSPTTGCVCLCEGVGPKPTLKGRRRACVDQQGNALSLSLSDSGSKDGRGQRRDGRTSSSLSH